MLPKSSPHRGAELAAGRSDHFARLSFASGPLLALSLDTRNQKVLCILAFIVSFFLEKHLTPRKQSIGGSHGLDHKGSGEEGHEGKEDENHLWNGGPAHEKRYKREEDHRGAEVSSIFERRWQGQGSGAHNQVEDVDQPCEREFVSKNISTLLPVRRLY